MVVSLQGTRLKILAILQKQGSVTVDQLSQSTGLAPATLRRHLHILQRDHLVSFQQVRKKPGRPEFSYFLTEDGQESGYRDYQQLLTFLLGGIKSLHPADLANKEGEDLLNSLMSQMAGRSSSSYLGPGQQSQETRITLLERALADVGFSPEVSRENGRVHIRLCNCPFRTAALSQESVCLFDHNLIANILGVDPVRQSTIRNGDSFCSYVATLTPASTPTGDSDSPV